MTPGHEALRLWIKRMGLSNAEAAAEIGMTAPQLSQILSQSRQAGLDIAMRIESATGVPARSWLLSRQGKKKTPRAQKATNTDV